MYLNQRVFFPAAGLLAAIALTACAAPAKPISPVLSTTAPAVTSTNSRIDPKTIGHVMGFVYQVGGPPDSSGHNPVQPMKATVTARSLDAQPDWSWTTESADGGSFTLDLPAGNYEMGGDAGSFISPQTVKVIAGATIQVELLIVVP